MGIVVRMGFDIMLGYGRCHFGNAQTKRLASLLVIAEKLSVLKLHAPADIDLSSQLRP
jgi:hypothetical protein